MSVDPTSTNWLQSYDPTDSSTLTSLLNPSPTDPGNSDTPAGFDVLFPSSSSTASPSTTTSSSTGLSSYQQALNALTVASDTFLIQSALGEADNAGSSSDSLSAALQAAEQAQASEESTQSQAALAAAQSAIDAGQTIDATA